MIGLLLSALLAPGLRRHLPIDPSDAEAARLHGIPVPRRHRGSDGRFKLVIAKLRAMPDYKSRAERNEAKRLRRARRLKGIHGS